MRDLINIAFSFDANYYRQAVVAISSLLDCADGKVSYNIYCLVKDDITPSIQKEVIFEVSKKSKDSKVVFVDTANYFDSAYECRGISIASYFRLALHNLLPVDKVIYADVDIIFNNDLSELYSMDVTPYYLGAVKDIIYNLDSRRADVCRRFPYWLTDLDVIGKNYRSAGFLIMNLKKLREANFDDQIKVMAQRQYNFQDQDIINILTKDKQSEVYDLEAKYNTLTGGFPENYKTALGEGILSQEEYDEIIKCPAVYHWAGAKPWDDMNVSLAGVWWQYVKEYSSYYKYFKKRYEKLHKEKRPKSILKSIFSIKNQNEHKVLTILGVRLKFKSKKRNKQPQNLPVTKGSSRFCAEHKLLIPDVDKVGKYTYCDLVYISGRDTEFGSFCSIGAEAKIAFGEHPTEFLSSSPFFYQNLGFKNVEKEMDFHKPCVIGNDVWIGNSAFIKGGVKIGDGAIVGAYAVVTKDVPPYAIVGGVPAKIIRYRFDEETIKSLLELKWWDLPDEVIKELPFENIQECIKKLKTIRGEKN